MGWTHTDASGREIIRDGEATEIGSPDTGASYFARDGKVYAKRLDGAVEEAGTALSANGRELDRHQAALSNAQAQREKRTGEALLDTEVAGEFDAKGDE